MTTANSENRLNELSAQDWLKFTKTWFIHNPSPRKENEILHPAKYPESLIEEFIRFFTKIGAVVFDPFLGTGSTLIAAHNCQRHGLGIELQEKYAQIAKERLRKLEQQWKLDDTGSSLKCKQLVLQGDSAQVDLLWKEYSLPLADLVITSPPYGTMLNKKGLVTKEREKQGLDLNYSQNPEDLSNAENYGNFLTRLVKIFISIKKYVKANGYLVVILQNYMDKGEYKTLAWDFAKEMTNYYQLRGERIWCQDNKTLYPYGYKYSFVPNVHHHYCLIFKNVHHPEEKNGTR